MFPSHCKEVSFKKVDFDLSEENIRSFLKGKKAYIRTRFFVFQHGDEWAVALIVRKLSNEILQEIASVHILSLPSDTRFVEDPGLEVLSASMMGALREKVGSKCVVVRGKAEHLSFFIGEPPYTLTIFDVVPPAPSKLVSLVQTALETDLQDRYVKCDVVEMDLNELARGIEPGKIMFPCRASGLGKGKKVLFLDETPNLSKQELQDLTLVGCSLSARIFKAVYGVEPKMINMCPQDMLREKAIRGPVLIKCCKVKEGCDVKGDVAIVPWGARAYEVTSALKKVLR